MNLPRSMIFAVAAVTGLYVVLCLAFLHVLGLDGLAALGATWTDAGTGLARALDGTLLEKSILVLIGIAILTSINGTVLGGSRVAYAMASGGAFWSPARVLDHRGVPARALWLQCALALVYVGTGTFDAIVEMTSLAMLVTGGVTVSSLFVLRRTDPRRERPYRALGYPWLPAIYLLFAAFAFAAEVWEAIGSERSGASLPFVGLAILALAYVLHRSRAAAIRRPP